MDRKSRRRARKNAKRKHKRHLLEDAVIFSSLWVKNSPEKVSYSKFTYNFTAGISSYHLTGSSAFNQGYSSYSEYTSNRVAPGPLILDFVAKLPDVENTSINHLRVSVIQILEIGIPAFLDPTELYVDYLDYKSPWNRYGAYRFNVLHDELITLEGSYRRLAHRRIEIFGEKFIPVSFLPEGGEAVKGSIYFTVNYNTFFGRPVNLSFYSQLFYQNL